MHGFAVRNFPFERKNSTKILPSQQRRVQGLYKPIQRSDSSEFDFRKTRFVTFPFLMLIGMYFHYLIIFFMYIEHLHIVFGN